MKPIGNIDLIDANRIHGWIWNPKTCRSSPVITANDRPLPLERHPIDRPDVLEAGLGLESGFTALLPETSDMSGIILRLRDADDASHLVAEMLVPQPSSKPEPVRGHIDAVTMDTIDGWIAGQTRGGNPILTLDGSIIPVTRTSIPRRDVADAGLAEQSGFSAAIPADLWHRKLPSLSVVRLYEGGPYPKLVHERTVNLNAVHKTRAAVVVWDLAHNPAGRALVLYEILERLFDEVHLIGPLHRRFGGKLWLPIVGMQLKTIAEPVDDFADLQSFTSRLRHKYDLVWICKPRFPSFYIANQITSRTTKILLDIDDHELAFFPTPPEDPEAEIRRDPSAVAKEPFGLTLTSALERHVNHFPLRTVSNIALQQRFGGTIIRHARNEVTFGPPDSLRRTHARRNAGISDSDFIIMFLGTVRNHKGVPELISLVQRPAILARRVRLFIVGADDQTCAQINSQGVPNVHCGPGVDFSRLPDLLRLADAIVLPQDPENPISEYQIPAKISDALATAIPVIITDVPPVADLHEHPGIHVCLFDEFESTLIKLIDANSERNAIHHGFLHEFSTSAMERRLREFVEMTTVTEWDRARSALRNTTDHYTNLVEQRRICIRNSRVGARDVVLLWKQNDLGMFNRRVDSIISALSRSPLIDRVICFEAPASSSSLASFWRRSNLHGDEGAMRVLNILGGAARSRDTSRIIYRTFMYSPTSRSEFLGIRLPPETHFRDWIRLELQNLAVSKDALLWCFPTNYEFSDVYSARDWAGVVADFVDDQVGFQDSPSTVRRVLENYASFVHEADVLVFSNENNLRRITEQYCLTSPSNDQARFVHPNAPDPDALRQALSEYQSSGRRSDVSPLRTA